MRRPGYGFNKAPPGSLARRATEDRELHRRIEAGRRRASEDAAAFDRWARNGCTARAELARFNAANWPERVRKALEVRRPEPGGNGRHHQEDQKADQKPNHPASPSP